MQAKAELMAHNRKEIKLHSASNKSKENILIFSICFRTELYLVQNLHLPKILLQDVFYLRKIT
jgi:glutamyl-tRNA reductase